MTYNKFIEQSLQQRWLSWCVLALGLVLTTAAYWPGLSGAFFFDDNPNIVDNKGVQPANASFASLVNAALSSPSSEFKRPLSSLSFAANYLFTGLDPYWMKLTNLVIHLINGVLVFLLARALLELAGRQPPKNSSRPSYVAAVIACGWMLLPINLTGVLYVVQRMESFANLFVLLGLICYVMGRRWMLDAVNDARETNRSTWPGFWICGASITIPAAVGLLAKETAIMLPLYAFLIEWLLLGFCRKSVGIRQHVHQRDRRLIGLFLILLTLPLILGLAWLLPGLLKPQNWATRNFTLGTRLLSETRIVVDYIIWTLLPTSSALSFYHDNFDISQGLLKPWTTLASILALSGLIYLGIRQHRQRPLVSLGIALFLGAHLLTATILPLELIYEHRNYFASFGLLLAVVPLLISRSPDAANLRTKQNFTLARSITMAGLVLLWGFETTITAMAWGSPLSQAEMLASRAPDSPRAQYELGRTYIIYSHYDPKSTFTAMAYAPLERAAALPDASILPEQALIFMNARMHLPIKDAWWDSIVQKLKSHPPGVQDESSLAALTECARDHNCDLPTNRMTDAYLAALSHPHPSARLLAMYGDYAWNVLNDRALGERMIAEAAHSKPDEPAYQITLIRMLVAQGRYEEARKSMTQLRGLNVGGRLNNDLEDLSQLPGLR